LNFEQGILESRLDVLLAYGRAISATGRGEFLESILDDKLDLPKHIPADPAILKSTIKNRSR
jgi:hypothetical protein